ncbi:protein FAM161B isoform X2 [Dendropsophus ebraccatus]|uniref:protein FAM161B isoform X2 n=1 Tax=Dendropsophus ebraccatus TaxID=150705 RepID=UPI00383227AE
MVMSIPSIIQVDAAARTGSETDEASTMARDQETDGRAVTGDVMEMLQSLKVRNSIALQELTSVYAAWGGAERPLLSKAKVKATIKGREITVPQPFQMMVREAEKRKMLKAQAWLDVPGELSVDDAECVKQFRAQPLPAHIFLPMYNEIVEENENRRKSGMQKRREDLMSMQKPFQLLVQDRNRPVSAPPEKAHRRRRPIPKSVLDPTVSDKLKEAEILRKINSHLRAKDLLASSSAPVPLSRDIRQPLSRTSLKIKQQHLGFLQQDLTFQPQVNQSVPDFQKLYRNFQKLSLKKQRTQEPTASKPFNLRTSSVLSKSRSRTEVVQENPPQRPSTYPSSLSLNTLPVYITDGTKRREVSIRSSLQERENQDIKREKWLRKHQEKSLAMRPSLSRRAKALDPHKPLAACMKEKLEEMRLIAEELKNTKMSWKKSCIASAQKIISLSVSPRDVQLKTWNAGLHIL